VFSVGFDDDALAEDLQRLPAGAETALDRPLTLRAFAFAYATTHAARMRNRSTKSPIDG
jgi:hypothetical protein